MWTSRNLLFRVLYLWLNILLTCVIFIMTLVNHFFSEFDSNRCKPGHEENSGSVDPATVTIPESHDLQRVYHDAAFHCNLKSSREHATSCSCCHCCCWVISEYFTSIFWITLSCCCCFVPTVFTLLMQRKHIWGVLKIRNPKNGWFNTND